MKELCFESNRLIFLTPLTKKVGYKSTKKIPGEATLLKHSNDKKYSHAMLFHSPDMHTVINMKRIINVKIMCNRGELTTN